MKWEYWFYPKSKDRDTGAIQEAFKDMGKDGWELVTTYEEGNFLYFVFKRPAKGEAGTWDKGL